MRRWNEKEKLAGLLCLLAWLLAGWVYFVHLPLERARASARQACDEARRVQIAAANFANGHADQKVAQEQQQKRHAFLAQALPETLAQGPFLSHLERQAAARSLTLLDVAPQPAVSGAAGLRELPVRVRLAGDYFALLDFLQDMASLRIGGRFVEVRGIKVQSGGTGEPLTCELLVAVFALPGGKDAS